MTRRFWRAAVLWTGLLAGGVPTGAQTTVLTEDFSGTTNIFGVTAAGVAEKAAAVYDTGLAGFGKVLAVCNTTAEGTLSGSDGKPVEVGDGTLTAEWDAFHGYLSGSASTTVSLLNSDGKELASYVYSAGSCLVTAATIGGQAVVGFESIALQSKNGSSGANGWGGNGKPYGATEGDNPHVAVTVTARGGVTIDFTLQGKTTTVRGSVGELKKDLARLRVVSSVGNTDRCYAIDNVKLTTGVLEQDDNYVEPIVGAVIAGEERLTFGPSPDEAFDNAYTVNIVGADGTTITEDNLSDKVTDFKVVWDMEGFRTANDTEGQYCDSYGAFTVNGEGKVKTVFALRDVPMNFYGKLTATITYNGTTTTAEKYVVALGDLSKGAAQVLPLAGYPADFSAYADALVGYKLTGETYGAGSDLIVGGWCVAGSDSHSAVLRSDADGTKFVRLTASTAKKSHVLTKTIEAPTGQVIFAQRLRFNAAGAVVTLTGGYPFWSANRYTCPVTLGFDGAALTLNGTPLTLGDTKAAFTAGAWYDVVLSADKSSERCYAQVCDTQGKLLGESGVVAWAETSSPTFFSIGIGNNNTGSVDIAACEAFVPTADAESYTLSADKTTLSIPQGESARLTASLADANGYAITQLATWAVQEEDMQQAVIITPDEADSHNATVTLSPTAEAGTATVQVSIGGSTKTIALAITSSAESIKFTQSTTSVSIPMDAGETATATFAATVIDGEGNEVESAVTLAAYDKEGLKPYTFGEGMAFDAATGVLTVAATASPALFTIRATGKNSAGEELTKSVKVNVHGMKFDFGQADDDAVAEGFTPVSPTTAYAATAGYGIASGTATAGGTASATNAESDYLQGNITFNFKAQKGDFYEVEITYQGTLTTGYVNSDLAGYELGTHSSMATDTYVIPATLSVIDLHIAAADATSVARIAKVTVAKQPKRQKRGKRVVHHIGDSTSANNGSWAYRLKNVVGTEYPELDALCTFHNDGAGGRNLSTYYTQGKLASVLRDIYPDDIVMFGNNGTNGMGSSFEDDMNYYLDAAEALGAKIIINSYTPHGAVSSYSGGYNSATHTFDSYRKDSYETVVRRVAAEREKSDENYLGFVEIGKNADAIFNAYVADYAAGGYATADAAAQAIIQCFTDHNHYSNGTLACNLMLGGYKTASVKGIVAQLVGILNAIPTGAAPLPAEAGSRDEALYTLTGMEVTAATHPGIYIKGGRKVYVK